MYEIEFYETADGVSELWNFLDDLEQKAEKSKVDEDIWELRPGNNRVLYFYFRDNKFVLLHQFRKKTQKTPRREIEKAKAERDDWVSRKG